MRIGQFNLNWPWKFLEGEQTPGPYTVPRAVQPVLDIAGHNLPVNVQDVNITTALILGANIIALPRGNDIGRFRLWSAIAISTDILTAGLRFNLEWNNIDSGNLVPLTIIPAGGYVAGEFVMLLGGSNLSTAAGAIQSTSPRRSVLVPGINRQLIVRTIGAAGTETVTLRAAFTEGDENEPLIYPFP